LNPKRVVELNTPLDVGLLYNEASWENRAQMSRTSARDFVEAVLLDVHHAMYLQRHPHVEVIPSLLQDQLLMDGEATLRRYATAEKLAKIRAKARAYNLDLSKERIKSDWIEPEAILREAWGVLPSREKAAIGCEIVAGFLERVQQAASEDPRPDSQDDPMEWHRHRIHPRVWEAIEAEPGILRGKAEVRDELHRWQAGRETYLARRPVYSVAGDEEP
jgi:hypothetical protein